MKKRVKIKREQLYDYLLVSAGIDCNFDVDYKFPEEIILEAELVEEKTPGWDCRKYYHKFRDRKCLECGLVEEEWVLAQREYDLKEDGRIDWETPQLPEAEYCATIKVWKKESKM